MFRHGLHGRGRVRVRHAADDRDDGTWKPIRISTWGSTHIAPTPKHVAWYVGPKEFFGLASDFFADQLKRDGGKKCRTKCGSQMHFSYCPVDRIEREMGEKHVAWWCVDADVPFLLFRYETDAELWLSLMRSKKKEK